jgi:hypothetical protein
LHHRFAAIRDNPRKTCVKTPVRRRIRDRFRNMANR